MCKICSKSTIKTLQQHNDHFLGIFVRVNFKTTYKSTDETISNKRFLSFSKEQPFKVGQASRSSNIECNRPATAFCGKEGGTCPHKSLETGFPVDKMTQKQQKTFLYSFCCYCFYTMLLLSTIVNVNLVAGT